MLEELKKKVCKANKDLVKHDLVLFSWGNASAIDREKGIVAIKPSGVDYKSLQPKDIVLVDLNGNIVEGKKRPSSDTPTHIELYKAFPDIHGIVHTHATHSSVFAQAKKGITCLGTTHADHFYGTIPCTRDLTKKEIEEEYEKNTGKVIVETFKQKKLDPMSMPAVLVSQHGPFTWGKDIDKAVYHAVALEQVAKIKLATLQLNPHVTPVPQHLLDKHYERKHGKNAYYGQSL